MMRLMDPMLAEMTTQALIANPMQSVAPQGGIGAFGGASAFGGQFANYASSARPQYSWRDGNSMGVNFPGGGGVATNGRDVFVL
jgi:hypothetical protein